MKRAEGYTADDGTWFATERGCKLHEEIASLCNLLSGQHDTAIGTAFDRANTPLANAIERAGAIIAAKRRAQQKASK
jgi:hypothetical protein